MGNKKNNQRYLFVFSSFRYFKVEGLGDASNWEKAIKNYMCNPCCEKLDLIYAVSRYCPVQSSDYLTLQQQFSVLSSIPNFHRWEARKSSGVKKDEYFVPQGKSPRNQLIRICTSETTDYDLIGDIVLSVVNNEFAHTTSSSHIKNKKRRINAQFKPRLTTTHILKYLSMSKEEFHELQSQDEFSQDSLYESFKEKQLVHGDLHWRINNNCEQLLVMNDYCSESGEFKVIISVE